MVLSFCTTNTESFHGFVSDFTSESDQCGSRFERVQEMCSTLTQKTFERENY
jgi:hypothetical protein